jgi:hypothetical protein
VTKIYDTPVQVSADGIVVNPAPDAVIIDGIEYRQIGR